MAGYRGIANILQPKVKQTLEQGHTGHMIEDHGDEGSQVQSTHGCYQSAGCVKLPWWQLYFMIMITAMAETMVVELQTPMCHGFSGFF